MSMKTPFRRYDSLWETYDADDLKKASVLWKAGNKLPKSDRIAYLIAALDDPQRLDAFLAQVLPHEHAALSLVKLGGGTAGISALAVAVRATGLVPYQELYESRHGSDPIAKSLLERGIVMSEAGYRYMGYHYSEDDTRVFVDDRILGRIAQVDCRDLLLRAAEQPTASTFRRVPSVMLEVVSILREVDDLGGIGLTKAGDPRANDMRKIARRLGWKEETEIDGLTFPEPVKAYINAMSSGGLLNEKDVSLVNAASLEQVVRLPAVEIIGRLMQGMLKGNDWREHDTGYAYYAYQRNCTASRFAVITALRCLPERMAWFQFADFERALFQRIGETYSIVGVKSQPYIHAKTPAQQSAALDTWRQEVREAWETYDVPWIQAIFQTWLYAFGLIELHLIDDAVERFRLTDLGRAILWDEALEEQAAPAGTQAATWIVQPNFEVMVYLESASTEQIAFVAQHAERIQVSQHIAQYRLTRDSVYEGLQRGGSVDGLIEGLTVGSRVGLPGNVQSEIRTWAALRDRITVRQRADLIEFSNMAERQKAIGAGMAGLPVADRFLLLQESGRSTDAIRAIPTVLDYSHKPDSRTLSVAEDGVITLAATCSDLLTRGILDLWAERVSGAVWRLTRKSVEQAIQRGRKPAELHVFLQERLAAPIPGMLLVALQSWTSAPVNVSLATAVILQCTQPEALDAMLNSEALKPYLIGRIGPDTILVRSTEADAVRAVLVWAGVQVSAKIASP